MPTPSRKDPPPSTKATIPDFDSSPTMSVFPPAIFGMWSVCSVLFTAFCIYHLWHYDRFRCLRINQGPYSGAFKRVMTYTYLLTLPLMTTYSVGNAVIKYKEGFIFNSQYGVIPKPYTEWTKAHQNATFPLLMLLSLCFSLGMIADLEELCFWMFLMNATASSQNWFRSIYFLIWSCGSMILLVLVPTVSLVFRNDPLKDELYTFLVGSSCTLVLILFFFPILYLFPTFLHNLVIQGVDKTTLIRLRKFNELNRLRVAFKLLFAVPFLIITIDGVAPDGHSISVSMFWTEILGMFSAFGCIVSSAITLLIFFPRNSENEYESSTLGHLNRLEELRQKFDQHHKRDALEPYHERNRLVSPSKTSLDSSSQSSRVQVNYPTGFTPKHRADNVRGLPPSYQASRARNVEPDSYVDGSVGAFTSLPSFASDTMLHPNRLGPNGNVELGGMHEPPAAGTWVKNWTSQFKSPVDVMQLLAY